MWLTGYKSSLLSITIGYIPDNFHNSRYKALNSSVPKIIKPTQRKNKIDSRQQDSRIGLFRIKHLKYLPTAFWWRCFLCETTTSLCPYQQIPTQWWQHRKEIQHLSSQNPSTTLRTYSMLPGLDLIKTPCINTATRFYTGRSILCQYLQVINPPNKSERDA